MHKKEETPVDVNSIDYAKVENKVLCLCAKHPTATIGFGLMRFPGSKLLRFKKDKNLGHNWDFVGAQISECFGFVPDKDHWKVERCPEASMQHIYMYFLDDILVLRLVDEGNYVTYEF